MPEQDNKFTIWVPIVAVIGALILIIALFCLLYFVSSCCLDVIGIMKRKVLYVELYDWKITC